MKLETCPSCNGSGKLLVVPALPALPFEEVCPECKGTGTIRVDTAPPGKIGESA